MITINWSTRIISVPQNYLTSMGGQIYQLDVNQFHLDLKALEESDEGMVFESTHNHTTALTLSGVTYSRFVEIINGYTVDFENGMYTIVCVGANHNIADVKTVNSVSLIIGNAAGLITVVSGSGVTPQDKTDIITGVKTALDPDIALMKGLMQHNFRLTNQVYDSENRLLTATIRIYNTQSDCDNQVSPIAQYDVQSVYDISGNLIDYKVTN